MDAPQGGADGWSSYGGRNECGEVEASYPSEQEQTWVDADPWRLERAARAGRGRLSERAAWAG